MMENTLTYKGYFTNIKYSAEDNVLYGKIEGIDDLVTFESESSLEIENEFRKAVDDYLVFCEEVGKEPSKTYKGTFNVRIDPFLHKEISFYAFKMGISLNQSVEQAIRNFLMPSAENKQMASIEQQLSEISTTLSGFRVNWKVSELDPNYTYVTYAQPTASMATIKG